VSSLCIHFTLNTDGSHLDCAFQLTFSVPFDGANETLTVPSNISWTKFISKLADIMSLSPKNVRVAYRFSTDPRTSPFSHLSKSIHLVELAHAAKQAEKVTRSKKPFVVELKDLDASGKGKGSSKRNQEKGKKKKKKKKKVQVIIRYQLDFMLTFNVEYRPTQMTVTLPPRHPMMRVMK